MHACARYHTLIACFFLTNPEVLNTVSIMGVPGGGGGGGTGGAMASHPTLYSTYTIVLLRTFDDRGNNGLLLFLRLVVRSNVN